MNYIEFLSMIKTVVEKEIEQREWQTDVSIDQKITNAGIRDGLRVTSRDSDFSIFWQLEEEAFKRDPLCAVKLGLEMDVIVDDILNCYAEGLRTIGDIENKLLKLENVQDVILPVLYPKRTFELIDEKCPHREFLDLEICYFIFWEKLGAPIGTMLITNAMVNRWDIAEEDLNRIAMENVQSVTQLLSMEDFEQLNQDKGIHTESKMAEDRKEMYMIKYKMNNFGAAAILNRDKLNEYANRIKTKRLVLIPSSVHECLVMDGKDVDIEKLRYVIAIENISMLSEEDVLSYSPYYYDVEEGYGIYSEDE